jgi:hypothetical protein
VVEAAETAAAASVAGLMAVEALAVAAPAAAAWEVAEGLEPAMAVGMASGWCSSRHSCTR